MAKYKLFRQLTLDSWKYTEGFTSTLDPKYHEAINRLEADGINWKVVDQNDQILFINEKLNPQIFKHINCLN